MRSGRHCAVARSVAVGLRRRRCAPWAPAGTGVLRRGGHLLFLLIHLLNLFDFIKFPLFDSEFLVIRAMLELVLRRPTAGVVRRAYCSRLMRRWRRLASGRYSRWASLPPPLPRRTALICWSARDRWRAESISAPPMALLSNGGL